MSDLREQIEKLKRLHKRAQGDVNPRLYIDAYNRESAALALALIHRVEDLEAERDKLIKSTADWMTQSNAAKQELATLPVGPCGKVGHVAIDFNNRYCRTCTDIERRNATDPNANSDDGCTCGLSCPVHGMTLQRAKQKTTDWMN